MSTSETRQPYLLSASLLATPVIFFGILALVGPLTYFTAYLALAWTVAAIATAVPFGVDREYMAQFSNSELLAIVAGNGLLAMMVATTGFAALS